jgi:hypothetical protein
MMLRLASPVPRRHRLSGSLIPLGGLLCLPSLFFLGGCSKEKVEYYETRTVEAESATQAVDAAVLPPGHPPLDGAAAGALPPGHPPLGAAAGQPEGHPPMAELEALAGMLEMEKTALPDALIAQGGLPAWELPEGWVATDPGPMRRANFALGEAGLEVAVTSFPGNVGGMPANVNRWRRQLGLPPVAESQMLPFLTQTTVNGKEVLLVDLLGAPAPEGKSTQRMITAVANHEGASWFFKIAGDAAEVEAHRQEFVRFILSLRFPEKAEVTPDS